MCISLSLPCKSLHCLVPTSITVTYFTSDHDCKFDLDLWSLETVVMTGRVDAGSVDKPHCQKYGEKTPVPPKKQTRKTTFPFCEAGNLPLFAAKHKLHN